MRKVIKKTIPLFLMVVSFSLHSWSGGFQVNLQSTRSSGMGHTGTGLRLGAASGFFNPGALAFSNTEISIGIHLIKSRITYLEPFPGVYSANTTSGLGTPFAAHISVRPKSDSKLIFGFSAYTPFGSGVSYADDWKGQFLLREMSLRTIFYQGTLAYRITDKLGIGIGYVFGTGEFSLRRAIPIQFQDATYGEAVLSGKGSGNGFNFGIYYQLADNISMGVSYRSGVQVNLEEGSATFQIPQSLQNEFPQTTFSSQIGLPQVINWGIGINATEKTLLSFDANFVGWSSYDTLSFDFRENTDLLEDSNEPRNYKNTVILRAGIEQTISSKLQLRGGIYYDFSPVQDGYLTPETPDMNKIGICTGLTYHFSDHFQINSSLLYIHGNERVDKNFSSGFEGTWKAHAFIGSVSLCYKL